MNKIRIALFIIGLLTFSFYLFKYLNIKENDVKLNLSVDSTQSKYSKTFLDVGNNHKRNVPIKVAFTVYNTGDKPLYIQKVEPDCHCTVADYSINPILHNDSTIIFLKYEASNPGPFQSSATVTTNSPISPTLLIFRGVVDK